MRRLYLILGISILALLLVCSKKSTGPDDNLNPSEIMRASLALQDSVGQRVVEWLAQTDTTAALNSGIRLLMDADDLVDTAFTTEQGIAIQFKNGMQGGIMIDAKDGLPLNIAQTKKREAPGTLNKPAGSHPEASHTLFLCPIYDERQEIADSLMASAEANLAKAGYNEFTKYLGSNCTLQTFRQLDNFGFIHIYSHSFVWPGNEDQQEVYLMSGEKVATVDETLQTAIEENRLAVIYVPGQGSTYFLAPSYLNPENNLTYESPLVYLGFGNGFNSEWQEKFLYMLHAGACIGYDWYISAEQNLHWAGDLYGLMGDTSQVSHITLQEWHNSIDTSYQYDESHGTSIEYFGPDDFYIWRKVKIFEVSPQSGQAGDTITIRGGGFGEIPELGAVLIGNRNAHTISWSDTLITAIVPSGTSADIIRIKVGNIYSDPIEFIIDYVIKILSVDPDSAHPGETVRISGYGFGKEQGDKVLHVGVLEPDPILWSDTLITFKIPQEINSGDIYISLDGYTSNTYHIEIISDMIITKIVPDSGTVLDTISICGKGFGETGGSVYYNERYRVQTLSWTDTLILITYCGNGLPGEIEINVSSGSLTTNKYPFRQLSFSTIISISPELIRYGDTVEIRGEGFGSPSPDIRLGFGGSSVKLADSAISWSDSLITVPVPNNCKSGDAYVYNYRHGIFWSNKYNIAVFGIRYLDPNISQDGKRVKIVGSGFGDTQNGGAINFGSPNYWSDTLIDFEVPPGATTREIYVTVDGKKSNAKILRFPQIFSVTPLWTAPGQQVEIRGSDFGDTSYTVSFYEGVVADVDSWEDSLIIATVPEDAHSGQMALTFPRSVRYFCPSVTVLRIEKLWPNYGLPSDTLEIHGTGFLESSDNSYITFDQIEAEVVSWSDTLIKTIVPVNADTCDVFVHVNNLKTNGADFYFISLGDIYNTLGQTIYVELDFSGYITLDYFGLREAAFRQYSITSSSDSLWRLAEFSAGGFCGSEWQCYGAGISGLGDSSMMFIDSVYGQRHDYMDEYMVKEITVWNKAFSLHDVPFSRFQTKGDTIFAIYELIGPEVQNKISNISIYQGGNDYDNEDFIPQPSDWYYDYEYYDTDWYNEEYPPKIRIVFCTYIP